VKAVLAFLAMVAILATCIGVAFVADSGLARAQRNQMTTQQYQLLMQAETQKEAERQQTQRLQIFLAFLASTQSAAFQNGFLVVGFTVIVAIVAYFYMSKGEAKTQTQYNNCTFHGEDIE